MNKETIIANLRKAIEVMQNTPDDRVDLNFFKKEYKGKRSGECETHACLAGWLSMDEYFQKLGLSLMQHPNWKDVWFLVNKYDPVPTQYSWLNDHFGKNAFHRLFESREVGAFDHLFLDFDEYGDETPESLERTSDKDLAIKRLEKQIEEVYEL